MLTALSPTAALRADMDRSYAGPAAPSSAAHGDDLAAWTLVATALGRLDALAPEERLAHAARAGRALAARGVAPETGTPARPSVSVLARTFRRWARGLATPADVIAAARDVVEDMERAGALSLARTSLVALLGIAADAGAVTHGVTLAHLGRVVRQMGELDDAIGLYDAAARLAERAGDDALAARAAVGSGVIYGQRGNFPAARAAYKRALALAEPGTALAAGAHHGLMLAAISAGDLPAALEHGWRAFADAEGHADRRAEALVNLGGLCRRAGDYAAALRAFQACLALTQTPRLRLHALGSAAMAAAQSDRAPLVAGFVREADEEMTRVRQPYEAATTHLDLGEALAAIGEHAAAVERAERARALASHHRFHELEWRADHAEREWALRSAEARSAGGATAAGRSRGGAGVAPAADDDSVMGQVRRLPLRAADLLAVR